jgi:hypothetical protein
VPSRLDLEETSVASGEGLVEHRGLRTECALGAAIEQTSLQEPRRKSCALAFDCPNDGVFANGSPIQERPH